MHRTRIPNTNFFLSLAHKIKTCDHSSTLMWQCAEYHQQGKVSRVFIAVSLCRHDWLACRRDWWAMHEVELSSHSPEVRLIWSGSQPQFSSSRLVFCALLCSAVPGGPPWITKTLSVREFQRSRDHLLPPRDKDQPTFYYTEPCKTELLKDHFDI